VAHDADVTLATIRAARNAVAGVALETPVLGSTTLSERCGGDVLLKAEVLQLTGSFKLRGALNKLAVLGPRARTGVVTGSAGNHAQALAYAARHFGVPCEIVVPVGAPVNKIEACESYGAVVHEHGAALAEAVAEAHRIEAARGLTFCAPFDDPAVAAGQGTLGLEVLDAVPDVATVIVPLGGGGLASGTAIAIKSQRPDVRVIGVQAEVCAPYAGHRPPTGPVLTLADGIAVKYPGEITGPLVRRWLDGVVTVDEDSIADAMVLLADRSKLISEGAGAVGVAALITGAVEPSDNGPACVVISGGNVDLGVLPGAIRRNEQRAGRRLAVFARIDDRPGSLARLLALFADGGADLIDVEHLREGVDLHVRETGIAATFAVRNRAHGDRIVDAVRAAGYDLEVGAPA
jgi:threonine dehydratase